MARIKSIEIHHIKGIKKKKLDLDLIPNKPSLLVAPNGFGKTSFATAFNSLNKNRINLDEKDYHEHNSAHIPLIKIEYVEDDGTINTYSATNESNDIFSEFDIQVIKNSLESKHTQKNLGKFTAVKSYICIPKIVLIEKIPEKQSLNYSCSRMRLSFGENGKILPNITNEINNHNLVTQLGTVADLEKIFQVKQAKSLELFKEKTNNLKGTAQEITKAIESGTIDHLKSIPALCNIVEILQKNGVQYPSDSDYYLSALQFIELYRVDKNKFKQYTVYCRHTTDIYRLNSLFDILKPTWKNIKPRVVKGQLILHFPEAMHISNGERDILCFISRLLTADNKFNKEKCVLIIDEIFDYLDDANIIAAQYYLSNMIQEYKRHGRQLYPIILTHLNPSYFKNYCFKDQKIYYLEKKSSVFDRKVYNIILKREDPSIKTATDKHYLHFNPNDTNLGTEFSSLGLDTGISTSKSFTAYISNQLTEYIAGNKYDPISVCCALRIKIEELVYNALDHANQAGFIDEHGTVKKLQYAEDKGVNIPEAFHLLGIIYNEAMHFRFPNQDNITPLFSKLNNLSIRHMIKEACSLTL